jgi:hypothetical protein
MLPVGARPPRLSTDDLAREIERHLRLIA